MDEEQLVDWYEVVQQVANGRTEGHACPVCQGGQLEANLEHHRVTVRCPTCGEGFVGSLAHGRDDAFFAAAIEMEKAHGTSDAPQQAQVEEGDPSAGSLEATAVVECDDMPAQNAPEPTSVVTEAPGDPEPWAWKLSPSRSEDLDALAVWMDVVESIHNGRRVGLNCPYCSEPLHDITVQPPHVRVRCTVCGEAFEGRLG